MGITERRLRERQQRIEGIIAAACRIFRIKGFHNTTMNDIADHSELSRRTVYLYFNSKEQVALAVTASTVAELEAQFTEQAARAVPAVERLRSMLGAYLALMKADPGRFQFLVSFHENARAVEKDNPELLACEASIEAIEGILRTVLEAGKKDGSLSFQEKSKDMARTVLFMVHSAAAASVAYKGTLGEDDGNLFADLFERVLLILEAHLTGNKKP
jgi:AcrR family transcriptional regulator